MGKRKNNRLSFGKIDTSKKENELRELLLDIVNEEGLVSRYILEGHLLYTLNCNTVQMDNIIRVLKDNEELYVVELSDGIYYKYYPKL